MTSRLLSYPYLRATTCVNTVDPHPSLRRSQTFMQSHHISRATEVDYDLEAAQVRSGDDSSSSGKQSVDDESSIHFAEADRPDNLKNRATMGHAKEEVPSV